MLDAMLAATHAGVASAVAEARAAHLEQERALGALVCAPPGTTTWRLGRATCSSWCAITPRTRRRPRALGTTCRSRSTAGSPARSRPSACASSRCCRRRRRLHPEDCAARRRSRSRGPSYSSICMPISTTRFGGIWKKSVAERALRDKERNSACATSPCSRLAREQRLAPQVVARLALVDVQALRRRSARSMRSTSGVCMNPSARDHGPEAVAELEDDEAVGRDLDGTASVTIDRRTTCWCSTLLCLKWCSNTSGMPPVPDARNTAVPARAARVRRSMSSRNTRRRQRAGSRCASPSILAAEPPGRHDSEDADADREREPAAVPRSSPSSPTKNDRSKAKNSTSSASGRALQPVAPVARHTSKNRTDVMAIVPVTAMPYAAARLARLLNAEHERDARDHEQAVDLGDVDLALGLVRRVDDRDARQVAELHGLARQRERARDQRLRRDDRRERREDDHRDQTRLRRHQRVERIRRGLGPLEQRARPGRSS